MPANDTVLMEGVRLIFRNFTGKEGQYNPEGARSFGVILPEDVAEQMAADGWNVKVLKPREDDEEETEPTPWLPVKVGYGKGKPPTIVLITDRGRTNMTEDTVDMLDWVDIRVDEATGLSMVDLIVRPYHYSVRGSDGIAAYLQSLYVTIDEDPLAIKYAEMQSQ
jgi:hypothetical protein